MYPHVIIDIYPSPHLSQFSKTPIMCSIHTTLRRFAAIIRNLHVEEVDPGKQSANATRTKKDPFWRIHWIEDFLNHLWKKIYVFGEYLSMDEFTIASKIRHILLMYCKNKPHKFGFKLYMSSCPSTGFCGHFQIHNGQQNTVRKMVSISPPISLYLSFMSPLTYMTHNTQVESAIPKELVKQGRTVICDNFYTCTEVIDWILDQQMHFMGTIRSDRTHIPRTFEFPLKPSVPKGTMRIVQKKRKDGKKGNYSFIQCFFFQTIFFDSPHLPQHY
jgi:hypothetical protein